MSKSLFKCAAIGGLIVFIWGMLSWMVFPWHKNCFQKFVDEKSVAQVIQQNAPADGIYILPNTMGYTDQTSKEQISSGMELLEKGPFVFASVRKQGVGRITAKPFILNLVTQMIGAWIVAWMLMQAKGLKFKKQVAFVTLFGLGVGVLSQLPDWNWRGFSCCYVLVHLFDYIVGWFLAGLAIAKLNKAK